MKPCNFFNNLFSQLIMSKMCTMFIIFFMFSVFDASNGAAWKKKISKIHEVIMGQGTY